MALTVTLPDGTELELPDGATGADAAAAIGPGLAKAALAVEVTEPGAEPELRDLARPLPGGARISILTERSGEQALELIRHDAAHVLATAVLELYDGVKISIGPPIEDGFYYDFEFPEGTTVSEADFPRIEERMREHVKAAEPFVREDVPVAGGARALPRRTPGLQGRADRRPARRVRDRRRRRAPDAADRLAVHERALHRPLPRPARPEHGDGQGVQAELGRRRLLARRLGAHDADADLRHRVLLQEGARGARRAHRAGAGARSPQARPASSGLFRFSEVSPGAAFWLPAGTSVFNSLVAVSRRMGAERGYSEVKTPQIYDSQLWKTSGHWDKYRDDMFLLEPVEGRQMAVKPMNCPGHCQLFSMTRHSYRDLPLRYSEPGLLHRNEPSGVLHGLLRVRHFAQDDGHIFCTEEQVQDEVARLPGDGVRDLRAVRLRRAPRALDAPGAADRRRRAVGPGRAEARSGARGDGARVPAEPGRRRLLRAQDRHAHDRLARSLLADRAPCSSTTRCPPASASATRARTTPSTRR